MCGEWLRRFVLHEKCVAVCSNVLPPAPLYDREGLVCRLASVCLLVLAAVIVVEAEVVVVVVLVCIFSRCLLRNHHVTHITAEKEAAGSRLARRPLISHASKK